jgi:hypothetical protein
MSARPPRLAALLALAGIVAACGRDRAGDAPEWLTAEPRQVNLEITLDTARARDREIGPEGGTVTATALDGTRFQLRIPKGALLAPERITMIPVRAVRGLPLRGDDFTTVQLEPSGLRLLQPATLTIRTKREIPAAEQVAFAYHGMGEDAHLYPLGMDPKRVEMTIQHFSGYGFGRAAPDDPGRLALQRATAVEARMAAHVAELIARAKRGEIDGDALGDAFAAAAVQYYDEVLAGILKTAETDDRMASCALQRGMSWQRELLLLGAVTDDRAQRAPTALQQRFDLVESALPRIVENAYTRGYERFRTACKRDHEFLAIRRLVALERQAQLMGLRTDVQQNLNDALEECLRFEVEFRSVFDTKTRTGGSHHDVTATLRTTVPLVPRPPLDSAPLQYVRFTTSGDPAGDIFGSTTDVLGVLDDARGRVAPAGTKPGTFVLHSLGWQIDNPKDSVLVTNCEGEDEKEAREVADTILVTFSPGVPRELVRFTPDHDTPHFVAAIRDFARAVGNEGATEELVRESKMTANVTEEQHWAQHWAHAHRDHEVGGGGTRSYDDVGGVYALKLAPDRTKGVWRADTSWTQPPQMGFSMSEQSHLIVRHVP